MQKVKVTSKASKDALQQSLSAFEDIQGTSVAQFEDRVRFKLDAAEVNRQEMEAGFRAAPALAEAVWQEMKKRDFWLDGVGEILAFQYTGDVKYTGEALDLDQIVESLSVRICGRVQT